MNATRENLLLHSGPAARSGARVDRSVGTLEYRRLVDLLRVLREQAGLTQAQLAERVGEAQAFVSNVERYQRRLDLVEFRVLAVAIGGPAAPLVAVLDVLDVMAAAVQRGEPQGPSARH